MEPLQFRIVKLSDLFLLSLDYYGNAFMLVALTLLVGILLWKWQHNHPAFDLSDLLTGDNGRVSLAKFGQASALVVSTWGFVALVQQGKLSEFYFIGYMAVWAGYRIAQTMVDKQAENQDGLSKPNPEVSATGCNCPTDSPTS